MDPVRGLRRVHHGYVLRSAGVHDDGRGGARGDGRRGVRGACSGHGADCGGDEGEVRAQEECGVIRWSCCALRGGL